MSPLRFYFSFAGRISRRSFWRAGMLPLGGVGLVLGALLNIAGWHGERVEALVNLLLLWPAAAVSAKRWHDRGHSGWWVLVAMVPLLGLVLVLLENGLRGSQPGSNAYGPAPER
jgi:uncharacterized membrane protein YhaH (DUF805 family)